MHYLGYVQPLTGLWVAGGHIIYRYGSPDGLTRHGRIATGYGYGSPNGLREDTVPIEAMVSEVAHPR
ncbi:MAG: hypothetical protein IKN99_07055 [Bacteroidales bacterium]|nr:hypothetical protein [Bacteroidales bacterium]